MEYNTDGNIAGVYGTCLLRRMGKEYDMAC